MSPESVGSGAKDCCAESPRRKYGTATSDHGFLQKEGNHLGKNTDRDLPKDVLHCDRHHLSTAHRHPPELAAHRGQHMATLTHLSKVHTTRHLVVEQNLTNNQQ